MPVRARELWSIFAMSLTRHDNHQNVIKPYGGNEARTLGRRSAFSNHRLRAKRIVVPFYVDDHVLESLRLCLQDRTSELKRSGPQINEWGHHKTERNATIFGQP